jgi:hypothetical protein
MYTKPVTPLSIGGVLDDAIKLYRASFGRCLMLSLIGGVLLGASAVYMATQMRAFGFTPGVTPGVATDPSTALRVVSSSMGVFFKFYLLISLVSLLLYSAIFAQVNDVAQGAARRSQMDILALALRRVPGVFVAAIIFGVAVSIGFVLLLVPGIFLWGKLQFFMASVFADDVGGIEALGRSWNVTTNKWWRSSTILTVAVIMIFILELVAGLGGGLLVALSGGLHSTDLLGVTAAGSIMRAVVYIFILPMLPAVMLSTYYDMKLRREGADLAARANSLQSA